MKSKLIVKVSFVILVLLNLVLIFLIVGKPVGPEMMGRNEGLVNVISDMLALDEAQKLSFETSAKTHSEAMMKLSHQQMKATQDYFFLLKSEGINAQEKTVALEKIKQIEGEKIRITFDHFEELKSMCTKEQLSKFPEVVDQVIPMILGNRKNNSLPPRDK